MPAPCSTLRRPRGAKTPTALISKVYTQLQSLVAKDDSTVMVTVTTAVEMDDELREKVLAKAHELFNAAIYLVERIDPNILGGIIIEGKGRRYDASVRAQLATVRTALDSTFLGGEV